MPEQATCCCCIPLRIGVIILAVGGIIGSLKYISQGIHSFLLLDRGPEMDKPRSEEEFLLDFTKWYALAILVMGILHLILASVLLRGVVKRNPRHLRYWVKAAVANVFLTILVLTGVAVMVIGAAPKEGGAHGIPLVIAAMIGGAVECYYILQVYRLAIVIEEEDGEQIEGEAGGSLSAKMQGYDTYEDEP